MFRLPYFCFSLLVSSSLLLSSSLLVSSVGVGQNLRIENQQNGVERLVGICNPSGALKMHAPVVWHSSDPAAAASPPYVIYRDHVQRSFTEAANVA